VLYVFPDSQVNPSSTIPRPDVDHTRRQARPIRARLHCVQLKQPDGDAEYPHLIDVRAGSKVTGLADGFFIILMRANETLF
jgi:hypothetical protein